MKFPLQLPIDNSLPRVASINRDAINGGGGIWIELHTPAEVNAVRSYMRAAQPSVAEFISGTQTAINRPTISGHALSADLPPPADYVRPTAAPTSLPAAKAKAPKPDLETEPLMMESYLGELDDDAWMRHAALIKWAFIIGIGAALLMLGAEVASIPANLVTP